MEPEEKIRSGSSGPLRIPLLDAAESVTCCQIDSTFPYRDWPFLLGRCATPVGTAAQIDTTLRWRDYSGHWLMRWGIGRQRYRVRPGLYAVGAPDAAAAVLVTANYKLTFDVLRSQLAGCQLWILVLDTRGINVWCAAGKGTFGTEELIRRLDSAQLAKIVNHRTLIVPQLGAVGVAAHEVLRATGFRIVFGPVRASDLPVFLAAGMQATPAMRQVTFTFGERLVLTPVELSGMWRELLWAMPILFTLGGIGPWGFSLAQAFNRGGVAFVAVLMGLVCGAVLTPVLLPWLPGRAFALKGAVAGFVMVVLCVASAPRQIAACDTAAFGGALLAISSWCAMQFTGSAPFTSPSGVEKEMRRYIPFQILTLLVAGICWIAGAFQR